MECKQHEVQHLVIALDLLGRNFRTNRDLYYTLGRYLGYTDIYLNQIESQKRSFSLDIVYDLYKSRQYC